MPHIGQYGPGVAVQCLAGDGDRVSLKVRGANSLGVHVTADVVVGASKEGQQS